MDGFTLITLVFLIILLAVPIYIGARRELKGTARTNPSSWYPEGTFDESDSSASGSGHHEPVQHHGGGHHSSDSSGGHHGGDFGGGDFGGGHHH